MLRVSRQLLFLLLCLHGSSVLAAMEIRTIQLQGRQAEEIIPVLRPMLAPGGSLSGSGYKLIVKSTPNNIEQIRALLADIDKVPEQLLIFVSDDVAVLDATQQQSGRLTIGDDKNVKVIVGPAPDDTHAAGDARVRIGNDRIKAEGQATQQHRDRHEPIAQQVRVTEGLWASIRFGQAVPYATRSINPDGTVTETVTYEPITSGFRVLPRVNGDMVTLSIKPERKSAGPQPGGAYNVTGVETTLRAKFGEWVEIGGNRQDSSSTNRGIGYGRQSGGAERQRIFVKIERVSR